MLSLKCGEKGTAPGKGRVLTGGKAEKVGMHAGRYVGLKVRVDRVYIGCYLFSLQNVK